MTTTVTTIRYTFLSGNLDFTDMPAEMPRSAYTAYAEALTSALEAAFPEATVEVGFQYRASGAGPEVQLLDADGHQVRDAEECFRSACGDVWESWTCTFGESVESAEDAGKEAGRTAAEEQVFDAQRDGKVARLTPPTDAGSWSTSLVNALTERQLVELTGTLADTSDRAEWLSAYDAAAQAAYVAAAAERLEEAATEAHA